MDVGSVASGLSRKSPPQDQLVFLEMRGFRGMSAVALLPSSPYPASLAQVRGGCGCSEDARGEPQRRLRPRAGERLAWASPDIYVRVQLPTCWVPCCLFPTPTRCPFPLP